VPLVVGRSQVPKVRDLEQARANPELAVLSAMAHGQAEDPAEAVEIATLAIEVSRDLEADRSVMYLDLVCASLSEAGKSLLSMDPAKYEFQSDIAKRAEQRGVAQVVLSLLRLKFGEVDSDTVARVEGASVEELKAWAGRVLVATSLADVLR
jgi:hypothetical protein